MKTTIIRASLCLCMTIALVSCRSCKKRDIKPPLADAETASAVEAIWALFNITDAEQIVAFLGENQLNTHFYVADPGVSPNGVPDPTRNVEAGILSLDFRQGVHCADGKSRFGGVFSDYLYSEDESVKKYYTTYNIPNTPTRFYHEYGFLSRLSFSQYKVNGWTIKTDSIPNTSSFSSGVIYNFMQKPDYDPRKEPLKIRIIGSFVLLHPTDATKNMTIKCDLIKTVMNSTSASVFPSTLHHLDQAVDWYQAKVSYSGKIEGTTSNHVPYRMEIGENNPLIRDFTCSPDKVSNAAIGTGTQAIVTYKEEFHPFSSGIVSFTTTQNGRDLYPRMIYFGNEGHLDLPSQCDNSGEIVIKGISYKVDFWK